MTCKVCHGYGFMRDGKPLSPANTCVHCIDANVCPKCEAPMHNDHEPECDACGWVWDDPANLTPFEYGDWVTITTPLRRITGKVTYAENIGENVPYYRIVVVDLLFRPYDWQQGLEGGKVEFAEVPSLHEAAREPAVYYWQ